MINFMNRCLIAAIIQILLGVVINISGIKGWFCNNNIYKVEKRIHFGCKMLMLSLCCILIAMSIGAVTRNITDSVAIITISLLIVKLSTNNALDIVNKKINKFETERKEKILKGEYKMTLEEVIEDWKRIKSKNINPQKIYVLDKVDAAEISKYIEDIDKAVFISISRGTVDETQFDCELDKKADIYRMHFADCLGTTERLSAQQAEKLWQHMDTNKNKYRLIIVNCHAGKSRSVAVGQAISQHYGIQIEYTQQPTPNSWVVSCMREARKYIDSPDIKYLSSEEVKTLSEDIKDDSEVWVKIGANEYGLLPGYVKVLPRIQHNHIRLNDVELGYGADISIKEVGKSVLLETY